MLTLRHSHRSHGSRMSHYSPVSPGSPQMWMMLVDYGVDNRLLGVRSVSFVRLSPSVDPLWIPTYRRDVSQGASCAQQRTTCGGLRSPRRPSPKTHNLAVNHPQGLPSRKAACSSRKDAPSTISPRPTTMTTDIDPLFTHRLRAAGGGYLPYCLSPTGRRVWRTPSGGRP